MTTVIVKTVRAGIIILGIEHRGLFEHPIRIITVQGKDTHAVQTATGRDHAAGTQQAGEVWRLATDPALRSRMPDLWLESLEGAVILGVLSAPDEPSERTERPCQGGVDDRAAGRHHVVDEHDRLLALGRGQVVEELPRAVDVHVHINLPEHVAGVTEVTIRNRYKELTERLDRIHANVRRGYHADSKERAKELEDNEVVDALGNEARAEIAKINAALRRMDNDEFGICVECGLPISEARIEEGQLFNAEKMEHVRRRVSRLNFFAYGDVSVIILVIFAVVLMIDAVSVWARSRLI